MTKFKILENITKTIFPETFTCVFCGDEIFDDNKYATCEKCNNKLPFITGKTCEKCGEPLNNMANFCDRCQNAHHTFNKCCSVFVYQDEIKNKIQNFKFWNNKYFGKPFAEYMANCYRKNSFSCDLVIPVPIHQKRLKERGYNQSEILAKYISQILNLPLNTASLQKIKQTKDQVDLDFKERKSNLEGAFKVFEKQQIKGKTILLVDDVFTTGSTLDACCDVLFKAGAKAVFGLTLAHTVVKLD